MVQRMVSPRDLSIMSHHYRRVPFNEESGDNLDKCGVKKGRGRAFAVVHWANVRKVTGSTKVNALKDVS